MIDRDGRKANRLSKVTLIMPRFSFPGIAESSQGDSD